MLSVLGEPNTGRPPSLSSALICCGVVVGMPFWASSSLIVPFCRAGSQRRGQGPQEIGYLRGPGGDLRRRGLIRRLAGGWREETNNGHRDDRQAPPPAPQPVKFLQVR